MPDVYCSNLARCADADKEFDLFIMAHNVRQVYYVPYPSTQPLKRGWSVAITTKPRGKIENDEIVDDEAAYQNDEISNVTKVIKVEDTAHQE
ncbi:hypothetical protein QL285_033603 [Trifolium repens]|nr:hypothetical protein QL285_033603 [Trifolium repens]